MTLFHQALYVLNLLATLYGAVALWRGTLQLTPTLRRVLAVLAALNMLSTLPVLSTKPSTPAISTASTTFRT